MFEKKIIYTKLILDRQPHKYLYFEWSHFKLYIRFEITSFKKNNHVNKRIARFDRVGVILV
jgi:hypothetical protein